MLSRVDESVQCPQALCVSPTRELARQIHAVTEEIGRFTSCTTFLCVPQGPSRQRPTCITQQVVIGTPGRMLDLSGRGLLSLAQLRIFVLDEADVMLSVGTGSTSMRDQSIALKRLLPRSCQYLLFSATFPDDVLDFAYEVVPPPLSTIKAKERDLVIQGITQYYVRCRDQEKFAILRDVFSTITVGQAIVFTETRREADQLTIQMSDSGFKVSVIHGVEMSADVRDKVLADFKNGATTVLITTNLLARGIDVRQVTLVINYDLPRVRSGAGGRGGFGGGAVDPVTYVHRIGRTGRYGRYGVAINLVAPEETHLINDLAAHYGAHIDELRREDIPQLSQLLVEVAQQNAKEIDSRAMPTLQPQQQRQAYPPQVNQPEAYTQDEEYAGEEYGDGPVLSLVYPPAQRAGGEEQEETEQEQQ
eukprot:TRINITY_DN7659_c0_g2_i1.p2 TRINITY_DN7659_c0_g2~~TRINITY_DN7659_c0_g2_i1.p2  ORF type:complete len:419 (+),score=119.56 TRINITY_DN7659_c0_g2_i1:173-1429(+)